MTYGYVPSETLQVLLPESLGHKPHGGVNTQSLPITDTDTGALLATVGLYFLSVTEGFVIGQGDSLVLIGALFWAIHVQIVGYASKKVDPLQLAVVQYAICSGLNFILALFFEDISMGPVVDAVGPILYAGLVSVGIAYTLQIIAQQHIDPSRAAILLSLEAVFAVLGGWLMLDETLSNRELLGCILMFAGMLLSQLPDQKKKEEVSSPGARGRQAD